MNNFDNYVTRNNITHVEIESLMKYINIDDLIG